MRNALTLLMIAAGLVVLAFLYPSLRGLLLWSGGSFATVAAAYALQKPCVFGKRSDGTMAPLPSLLLLPYLLLTWLLWYGQTRLSREAAWDEVAPGLWLGRRISAERMPRGVTLIVDLTSEFSEPRSVREGRHYLCLPALDNAAPERGAFQDAVRQVSGWEGGVYVHCALGHGRSALVVAAVMMARGLAATPVEALALLHRARPGVSLSWEQRAFLERPPLVARRLAPPS